MGSGNAAQRFALAGVALGEARKKNREENWPLVVEGKRDRFALEALGFTGPVEVLNRGWEVSRLVAYLYDKFGTRGLNGGP